MIVATWADLGGPQYRGLGGDWTDLPLHRCSGGVEGPYYLFEEAVARRLIERCREIGGTSFRISHDLSSMLITGVGDDPRYSMHANGWDVQCDDRLPPNSVVADASGAES